MDKQNSDMPDLTPDVSAETPEVKPEPKRRTKKVEVVAVSPMAFRDAEYSLVAAVNDPTEAWLLDRDMVPNSTAPFKVNESVLAAAPRPATFEDALAAVLPGIENVMLALWRVGIVSYDDLGNRQKVRRALNNVGPSPASLSKFHVKD